MKWANFCPIYLTKEENDLRGHIRKRGGTYTIVVDNGHNPTTGKRRRKWITVQGTKRDAERKLAEVLRELDQAV